MSCEGIPEYLIRKSKPKLNMDQDADPQDNIYRIKKKGNPVEVPGGKIAGLSCKWSKLIKEEHIPLYYSESIGDDYRYNIVEEIRKHKVEDYNEHEDEFNRITCLLKHVPEDCDYSHVEIDVRHQVYKGDENGKLLSDDAIDYDCWVNKCARLPKSTSKFYKSLRSKYRADLIILFPLPKTK